MKSSDIYYYKRIRITFLFVAVITFLIGCGDAKKNTDADKEEWISLFNGKDLKDWDIKFNKEPLGVNYKNTFQVADGMIRVVYDDYEIFDEYYAHLYYKQPFSYYKIRFDYRFTGNQTTGGATWNVRNSGVMIHSQSAASNGFNQEFPTSIEIQLLGGLEDGKERPTANLCTPMTAVEMNGDVTYDHCINSSSKTYFGDQWVHVEAIVLGGESVTHIVENDTVLVYQKPQLGSSDFDAELDLFGVSDKAEWLQKEGEVLTEGYIALQAESHPIDFKNIEVLDLCGCMDPKAKNYKSYYIKAANSTCIYDSK